jgi:uncharacterized membrane protein
VAEIAHRLQATLGGGGEVNVGRSERIASVLGGAALAGFGARRRGLGGALLGLAGAALVHRGLTGHSFLYGALGMDTAGEGLRGRLAEDEEAAVSVTASVTVNRPADELYAFWRDFRNAPRYMDRISRVEVLGEARSRWTATGPMGRSWEWESEVTEDRPGELIAWESLPGSDLPNRGWVQFLPAGDGRTEVRHFVEFDPPAGVVGQAVARVFHQAPAEMVRGDLRRFRALMEAGEIATTSGQPSAREEWEDDAGR